jgi:predicted phosphodiesterase
MANITHRWLKIFGLTCTHAKYVDPDAWEAALQFKELYKPHTILHLGDFIDLSALMGNGIGSGNDGDEVTPDIDTGLTHLRQLMAGCKDPWILCGNHEDRAWKLRHSKNSVTAYCAHKIVQSIEDTAAKLKARLVPYSGIEQIVDIADTGWTHGTCYGESSCRDMAEQYCNGKRRKIIFGHTHKVATASARTKHGGTGYNIGTLTARGALEYSKTRRSTFAWTQGWIWGEYCKELNQSSLQITQRQHGEVWRLPSL